MADKNLQKKIEEARAAGYSEEEIQNYLNPTPPAPVMTERPKQNLVDIMHEYNPQGFSQPMTPEQTGTAQFGGAQAAKYLGEGALGYGAYRGLKNIAQNFGNSPTPPAAPVSPPSAVTPEGTMEMLKGNPTQPGTNPYSAPAQQPGLMDRFGQLAQQYAPILQRYAGTVGRVAGPAALATYSPGLNAGEEQALIRIRAQQEAARKAGLLP